MRLRPNDVDLVLGIGDLESDACGPDTAGRVSGRPPEVGRRGGGGEPRREIFRGKDVENWRQAFYYHYYENPGGHNVARHYGVTDGRYKLIHYYSLQGEDIDDWELFDLEKDPEEMKSVYGDPQYSKIQKQKLGQLNRLRERYEVPEVDPVINRRGRS